MKRFSLILPVLLQLFSLLLTGCGDDITVLHNQNNRLLVGTWTTVHPFKEANPDTGELLELSETLVFKQDGLFQRTECSKSSDEKWIQKGTYRLAFNSGQPQNFQGLLLLNYRQDNSNYIETYHCYFSFLNEPKNKKNPHPAVTLQLIDELDDKAGKIYRKETKKE